VFDLLAKNNKDKKIPLTLYTLNGEVSIKNLTWIKIESKEDINNSTKEATEQRKSEATQFNSTSSRSHALFQIKLEQTKLDSTIITSIINIIDLAGSERSSISSLANKTKEEIEQMKRIQTDANFINKSLTTLGRIISMIGDRKSMKLSIPYRESKLTTLLQVKLN
jgi:hypothetical protein